MVSARLEMSPKRKPMLRFTKASKRWAETNSKSMLCMEKSDEAFFFEMQWLQHTLLKESQIRRYSVVLYRTEFGEALF